MAKTFFGLVAIAAVALAAWIGVDLVLGGDGDEGWVAAVIDGAGDEIDDDNVDDDDDDDDRLSAVTIVGGAPRLVLNPETQERAGIVTRAAQPAAHAARIAATATVLDIAPLIALRDGYIAAAYDAEVIGVETGALEQEYQRLRALYDDDANIAFKTVTRAEAAWRTGEARLRRAWARMHALRDRARLEWGAVLTDWAFDEKPDIKRLSDRSEALLLVALPLGRRLPANAETVSISHHGGGLDAFYISPAVAADPLMPGETHFFRCDGDGLRAGMRLDAWIAVPGSERTGAAVPADAVIWSLGQAWIYVQVAADQFERRVVPTDAEIDGGWFVEDAVAPGEKLVVAGAQMLFAEEFRWQIRDEDDD
jgi:hypothetical protein